MINKKDAAYHICQQMMRRRRIKSRKCGSFQRYQTWCIDSFLESPGIDTRTYFFGTENILFGTFENTWTLFMKYNLVALTGWIFTRSKHQVCRLENSQKIKSKKEKVHFSLMSKLKKEFIFGYLNGADHRLADQNWPSGIGKLRNLLPESFQILLLSSQQFPHCFLRRWKDRVNRILIKAGKCSARVLA